MMFILLATKLRRLSLPPRRVRRPHEGLEAGRRMTRWDLLRLASDRQPVRAHSQGYRFRHRDELAWRLAGCQSSSSQWPLWRIAILSVGKPAWAYGLS